MMTPNQDAKTGNCDVKTVIGFGEEWTRFDQFSLGEEELNALFERYFRIFPWDELPANPIGFDMGCGSGRWARRVAPRVGQLYCIDASPAALEIARRNLQSTDEESFLKCTFLQGFFENLPLPDNSMDFGYCLGVLHHIPDTASGIKSCVQKLKPGAPFLIYIYYALDNRGAGFRLLWRVSDVARRIISRLPFRGRLAVTELVALLIYYPFARTALFLEKRGLNVESLPLSAYRRTSLYTMRTDALDRFGTRLEKRFTARQIQTMMEDAGLKRIQISDSIPYWCALGYKSGYKNVGLE